MKTTLTHQVTNSIFEVMETMFFLTVEEVTDRPSTPSGVLDFKDVKACSISFSGSFSGTIFLLVPVRVLKTMAENFLGQDEELLSPEHVDGILKEALNMVAGNALTKAEEKSYMGLGIPEMVPPETLKSETDFILIKTADGMIISVVRIEP